MVWLSLNYTETHNFPTGAAPFPGAETGTGGRIRDVQGTGKGGFIGAGTAAYCVANLHIPGYEMAWEEKYECPANLASALEIEIEASNGASDYGNKFGEPMIQGFGISVGGADGVGSRVIAVAATGTGLPLSNGGGAARRSVKTETTPTGSREPPILTLTSSPGALLISAE